MKKKFTKKEILNTFSFAENVHNKNEEQLLQLYGDDLTIIDPFIKGVGDACAIIKDGDTAVVVFPGSKDLIHWFLNFYKYNNPESGVHPGMIVLLESMAEQILSKLMSLSPKKLLITGFSRGGGLADVFLEIYSHLLDVQTDCITFAEPRVFTREYYDKNVSLKDLESVRYLRVIMANDIVPNIPQSKYGYMHKGEVLRLGLKLSWHKQLKLAWKLWRNFNKFAYQGLSEHNANLYLAELKALTPWYPEKT